jgi:hypothetical protein
MSDAALNYSPTYQDIDEESAIAKASGIARIRYVQVRSSSRRFIEYIQVASPDANTLVEVLIQTPGSGEYIRDHVLLTTLDSFGTYSAQSPYFPNLLIKGGSTLILKCSGMTAGNEVTSVIQFREEELLNAPVSGNGQDGSGGSGPASVLQESGYPDSRVGAPYVP